ncbi:MAG: hypothetical protein ACFFAS_10800 [Promethearchaeota archaeon]
MKSIKIVAIIGAILNIIGMALPIIIYSDAGITANCWGFGLIVSTYLTDIVTDNTTYLFGAMMFLGIVFMTMGGTLKEEENVSQQKIGSFPIIGEICALLAPIIFIGFNLELLEVLIKDAKAKNSLYFLNEEYF